jgi:uncharacterized protein (DUF362 family)
MDCAFAKHCSILPAGRGGFFVDRRKFLTQVSLWSAGLLLSPPVFKITPKLFASNPPIPKLTVGKGTDYEKLVFRVLEPLGGISSFVKKDNRVVIKPNIGWDRRPEQAANTHPLVVKALVQMSLDAGASEVMIFDRPCNEERRTYNNSGIKPEMDSIKDPRVKCVYIDNRKFVPVNIVDGKSIKEWSFYKDALEADCYINVPIAKHHGASRLTIGLKNVMGVIGGKRGKIHQNMGQNLADLNTVIRPQLTVVDATRILLRNGPQGGNLYDVKNIDTIIASADTVAADAYATTLFGLKPEDIESTRAASQMGLGEMNLSKLDIITV